MNVKNFKQQQHQQQQQQKSVLCEGEPKSQISTFVGWVKRILCMCVNTCTICLRLLFLIYYSRLSISLLLFRYQMTHFCFCFFAVVHVSDLFLLCWNIIMKLYMSCHVTRRDATRSEYTIGSVARRHAHMRVKNSNNITIKQQKHNNKNNADYIIVCLKCVLRMTN